MGHVYVDVVIKGTLGSKSLRTLVDTGSTYIVVNQSVADELGLVKLPYSAELTLADKRKIGTKIYAGEVELSGRRGPVLFSVFDVPVPLLGVYALESLGLKPNPLSGQVEVIGPEGGYLLVT